MTDLRQKQGEGFRKSKRGVKGCFGPLSKEKTQRGFFLLQKRTGVRLSTPMKMGRSSRCPSEETNHQRETRATKCLTFFFYLYVKKTLFSQKFFPAHMRVMLPVKSFFPYSSARYGVLELGRTKNWREVLHSIKGPRELEGCHFCY